MNFKIKIKSQSFLAISIFLISLFCISCNEIANTSQTDKSELIDKVNAVQKQIMVQGNLTKEEEKVLLGLCQIVSHNDGLANYSSQDRILLKDVEVAPIYQGCNELLAEETKTCFKKNIISFIKREFNLNLLKDLNLAEQKQVDVFFVIDKSGNLTGMKVRDAEVIVQGEILRVLREMPIMKPAIHNGKKTSVLCSMVVIYKNELDIDFVYIPERPES